MYKRVLLVFAIMGFSVVLILNGCSSTIVSDEDVVKLSKHTEEKSSVSKKVSTEKESKRKRESTLPQSHPSMSPQMVQQYCAKLNKEGCDYIVAGQYDRALEKFNSILKINPKFALAYYNIACVYSLQNKLDEAINKLKEAMDLGYDDLKLMKTDPDLINLKNDERFIKMLDTLEQQQEDLIKEAEKIKERIRAIMKEIEEVRELKFATEPHVEVISKRRAKTLGMKIRGKYTYNNTITIVKPENEEELRKLEGTIIHELMHALQDQNFIIEAFYANAGNNQDTRLALRAVIEGEAFYVMQQVLLKRNPEHKIKDLLKVKGAIYRGRFFDYFIGGNFIKTIKEEKGWKGINDIYLKNYPESTEQILHPEKYLENEKPVAVSLPDINSILGEKWKKVSYNTLGEYGLLRLLSMNQIEEGEAKKAAEGWDGDAYLEYIGPERKIIFVCKILWNSEDNAQLFFNTYSKGVEKTKKIIGSPLKGKNRTAWKTDKGFTYIRKVGKIIYIIDGPPDKELVKTISTYIEKN